ncbi:hypothetical protein LQ948_08110 [Jiella sp. MQZ9-1]|uniref:Uncharacterized protein n=1 Tax=Jiella flava TaxID=2816857 RepID=A0A939JU29_9HYPH|nr:hypothetical protein [Jiella flava]MBO0662750.1 hypothetical protein [Jiella flava]MCD2471172.1 hypothetical protein [Jiella flava]
MVVIRSPLMTKKNVDPDETTCKAADACMKEDDGHNRHRAQAINFGTVLREAWEWGRAESAASTPRWFEMAARRARIKA